MGISYIELNDRKECAFDNSNIKWEWRVKPKHKNEPIPWWMWKQIKMQNWNMKKQTFGDLSFLEINSIYDLVVSNFLEIQHIIQYQAKIKQQ